MSQAVFDPRTGDLPREELLKQAQEALDKNPTAEVYFKFTCWWCGNRCTLLEPYKLYETGVCCVCTRETPLSFGGFTLIIPLKHEETK